MLQLPQHELRDKKRPLKKPAIADVSDAAIDDHGGIKDLVALGPRLLLEQPYQVSRAELPTLLDGNGSPKVCGADCHDDPQDQSHVGGDGDQKTRDSDEEDPG